MKVPDGQRPKKSLLRIVELFFAGATLGTLLIMLAFAFLLYEARSITDTTLALQTSERTFPSEQARSSKGEEHVSFPIGVNPFTKSIAENSAIDSYLTDHPLTVNDSKHTQNSWFGRMLASLVLFDWYQSLASPTGRILVILSGERKEEVAQHFGKILGWTEQDKLDFVDTIMSSTPAVADGKFYPGTYVVARNASPNEVAQLVLHRFETEVLTHYSSDIEAVVPLSHALTIASLLEREAYDFYGIEFNGHPNQKRILNVDDMDYFPMRKEFPVEDQTRYDKDDTMFGRKPAGFKKLN